MSESKFETMSSVADNYRVSDQESEQAINEILNNEDLANTWHNYHLIGDVMRDEIPTALDLNLSEQIASAIAAEPTILAPKKPLTNTTNNFKSKVIQFMKPVGQLAIAASAAGLMIIGVQQNTAQTDEVIIPSQIVQTKPFGGFANPVSYNYQQDTKSQQQNALEQKIEQQRRFQALLSDHEQQIKLSAVIKNDKKNVTNEVKTELETSH